MKNFFLVFIVIIFSINFSYSQKLNSLKDSLEVNFKGDAKIEIGSPYIGIEMHHSSPLLQRISLYYPAANSIDLSSDYWKRDSSFAMVLGLKIGETKEWIGFEPFEFTLTPFDVSFHKKDSKKEINISYKFSKDNPVMIINYEITNLSGQQKEFEFYSDIEASVKTSHTYKLMDKAWSEFDSAGSSIYINYDDKETQNLQIFSGNAGEQPINFSSASSINSMPANKNWWGKPDWNLNNEVIAKTDQKIPAVRYVYKKNLSPNEKMEIIQIFGSSKFGEGKETLQKALKTFKDQTSGYEKYVLNYINYKKFYTGDSVIDKSNLWAKAILAVNQHYINGKIEPMPCPAEYNFYFTHDVLLTDLAAVNFDLKRVKQDLEFIILHADSNKIIPHAYYWKDTAFVTEIAPPDNWNHFWFVIAAGSYLRHSNDTAFVKELYPYISKSIEQSQINRKENLIFAYRPDWWDIGRNFGPRSYMTILAIKSLKEYLFISSVLKENLLELKKIENDARLMQNALNKRLWSDSLNYLINYFEDGKIDSHFYVGSLLASHFNLLNNKKSKELINTASEKLLDPRIGIYSVYPMDFQNLIKYLKLNGNEAGDPHYYINGGVWPHGNAWYALGLIKNNENLRALDFIKKTMTLHGIINSPNGQPAMYEYRVSDKNNSEVYGEIDKPQFMWAGAWYLYSLYNLFGIYENNWNISFNPFLYDKQKECEFTLTLNNKDVLVNISGKGKTIKSIFYDDEKKYSAVVPEGISQVKNIRIILGKLEAPLLKSINAILESCDYNKINKKMIIHNSGFKGHTVKSIVISPTPPLSVELNGIKIKRWISKKKDGYFQTDINFLQKKEINEIIIQF